MKNKISPSLIFLQYQPKFLNFLKIFIPRFFVKLFFFSLYNLPSSLYFPESQVSNMVAVKQLK